MGITIKKPKLAQYQKDFLYCDARFTITEASTKIGKTFAHSFWIFERAHEPWNKAGFEHWWVAPVYGQAKIAFKRIKKVVAKSGLYKINESNLIITTPLGTHICFKSAENPDNLYGEDVYSCVFDEAPRAKYEAFVALRSTVTATKAPMKLIGNFGGSSNWMHLLKDKAITQPKVYKYFKITAWDGVEAGILDRAEIEQAQLDLPPKVFKQLYLAEEQESDDQLCSFDSIRDLWTNTFVQKDARYITADVALQGSDKFVVIVWEGWRIISIQIIDKCEADEVEKTLKSTADKFKVARSNIAYDADGLGAFLRGYLKGAKPFNNNGSPVKIEGTNLNYKNLKSQCGYFLANQINKKGVFIDCEIDKTEMIKQIECLQSYGLDDEGKIQLMPKKKIKELIGYSPDILDALLMKSIFHLSPKKHAPKVKFIPRN